MSRLHSEVPASSLARQIVGRLGQTLTDNGDYLSNKAMAGHVAGLESLDDTHFNELRGYANEISENLSTVFDEVGTENNLDLDFSSLSQQQKEAGMITWLASGDPVKYAEKAATSKAVTASDVLVVGAESLGPYGDLDYRDEPATESFDDQELERFMPFSIYYNMEVLKTDPFAAEFFDPVVISPDVGGLDMTATRVYVHNPVRHTRDGSANGFNWRPLNEAFIDHTILEDNSIDLIPIVTENGDGNEAFVSEQDVAPREVVLEGVEVTTAPLKIGAWVNLLALSHNPELDTSGVMDHTDTIDGAMALERVYVKLPAGDVVSFEVHRLQRRNFLKSPEGHDKELVLNFRTTMMALDANTLAIDQSQPEDLAPIRNNNWTVRIEVDANGSANVEEGMVRVNGSPIRVVGIEDADGRAVSLTKGGGKTLVDNLRNAALIGYDLDAGRTNSNRLTRGLLVNDRSYTERYQVRLGPPMSCPKPAGSSRITGDMEKLVNATRARGNNNAVGTILNYAETLKAFTNNARHGFGDIDIEGAGRHSVKAYYEERDLPVDKIVNSLRSAGRQADVSAVIVNTVREIASRMMRYSGYQIALDTSDKGDKEACLTVGTDTIIEQHLMIDGDERTFGPVFGNRFKIVTSPDARMDGLIILTFRRNQRESGVPDPLSFGNYVWIPELTSTLQVSRFNRTYDEAMVQPRSRHVCNLPIMAKIRVTGLEKVFSQNIPVDVTNRDGSMKPDSTSETTEPETTEGA